MTGPTRQAAALDVSRRTVNRPGEAGALLSFSRLATGFDLSDPYRDQALGLLTDLVHAHGAALQLIEMANATSPVRSTGVPAANVGWPR